MKKKFEISEFTVHQLDGLDRVKGGQQDSLCPTTPKPTEPLDVPCPKTPLPPEPIPYPGPSGYAVSQTNLSALQDNAYSRVYNDAYIQAAGYTAAV